ncbi:MAG TPA: alcohol dehydrogenase, partial [Gammaproteobacteria bacterium]
MKAIQMLAPGGPEQLQVGELAEPELEAPHQVKVRLKAAGVNPVDAKLRSRGLLYPDALPAILGC